MVNIVEAYINKLVLECPCPPRGLKQVNLERFSHPGTYIELKQPPINELPYVNRSFFYTMIQNLSLEHIIQIFTNLLMEKPVSTLNSFNQHLGNHSGNSARVDDADCLLSSHVDSPI